MNENPATRDRIRCTTGTASIIEKYILSCRFGGGGVVLFFTIGGGPAGLGDNMRQ